MMNEDLDTYLYGTLMDPVTGIPLWEDLWNINHPETQRHHITKFIHINHDCVDGHQRLYPGMLDFIERFLLEKKSTHPVFNMMLTRVLVHFQGASHVDTLMHKHSDIFLDWDIEKSELTRTKWLSDEWISVQRVRNEKWLVRAFKKMGHGNAMLGMCMSDILKKYATFTPTEKKILIDHIYDSIKHKMDTNPWFHLLRNELSITSKIPDDPEMLLAIESLFTACLEHIKANPHWWVPKGNNSSYHPGNDNTPTLQGHLLGLLLDKTSPNQWPWPMKKVHDVLNPNQIHFEPLGGNTRESNQSNTAPWHNRVFLNKASQWDQAQLEHYADLLFYCKPSTSDDIHQWSSLAKTVAIQEQWSQHLWTTTLSRYALDDNSTTLDMHKDWFQAQHTSTLYWAAAAIIEFANAPENIQRQLYLQMLYICNKSPCPGKTMLENIVWWNVHKTHPHIEAEHVCAWLNAIESVYAHIREAPIVEMMNQWLQNLPPLEIFSEQCHNPNVL